MLEVRDLKVSYGAIQALHGISLTVPRGEIVTLIGGNGAGKSTTLRAISGLVKVQAGDVTYDGRPVTNLPAHQIVTRGLSQVPAVDLGPESIYSGELEYSQRFLKDWVALAAVHAGGVLGIINTVPLPEDPSLIRYENSGDPVFLQVLALVGQTIGETDEQALWRLFY